MLKIRWRIIFISALLLLGLYIFTATWFERGVSQPRPELVESKGDVTAGPGFTTAQVERLSTCSKAITARLQESLVVFKTGATLAHERLPVHLKTTLQCVPNYVIYSDLEEVIDGQVVENCLQDINSTAMEQSSEFEIYQRLQEAGKDGLSTLTTTPDPDRERSWNQESYRLDKWKFLPAVEKALRHMPEAKWFIFVEGDTYIHWPNLGFYLSKLDASKPYYIGAPMQIDNFAFAHGGSGYVLSNSAMRAVSKRQAAHKDEYDQLTTKHSAGDYILGRVLKDVGVALLWSWPLFQGIKPSILDFAMQERDRWLWCYPAISYHHIAPGEVESLWMWETAWARGSNRDYFTLGTVFREYVWPQIEGLGPVADEWDNAAEGTQLPASLVSEQVDRSEIPLRNLGADRLLAEQCRRLCEKKDTCLSFKVRYGSCTLSESFKLGEKTLGKGEDTSTSGWMLDRFDNFTRTMDKSCRNVQLFPHS